MDSISSSSFPTQWTSEENELFEDGLAEFDHVFPDLFEKMACQIPKKTVNQIKGHYETLAQDIEVIAAGLVPLPNYKASEDRNLSSARVNECRINQQQRRKPNSWTSKEHQLFLEGLEKYGKGDWRSIARKCVISKTPTQVASHAQKHFLRLQRNMASSSNTTTTTSSRPSRNPTPNSEGASPSTMSSANLSTAPPPPPFLMSMNNSTELASLPSFCDFSTIEELDQLFASYSPAHDRHSKFEVETNMK